MGVGENGRFDELRRRISSGVTCPGDRGWDERRLGWKRSVDQRPAAVVEVERIEDIGPTVRFAAEHAMSVTAQPVGHGASSAIDGAILLRTSRLQTFQVDVTRRTVRVGAGVRWQQLNEALGETGLTALPGSSGDPSVVGYLLGGGMSWFGRKYGVAANHVRAVELITADGSPARVTRQHDPDLFWALRGAGGEFGIVTALEIDLVPAPTLYGGRMIWPGEDAADVFDAFVRTTGEAPDELTCWAWLINLPDLETIPDRLRGHWAAVIDLTFLGSPVEAEQCLERIRDLDRPVVDTAGPMSVAALSDIAAEPTDPMPVLDTGTLLHTFDTNALATLIDAVEPSRPSPLALAQIRQLGGALARRSRHPGSAGHVEQPFSLVAGGVAESPADAPALSSAIARLRTAMEPYDSGRSPLNFGDDAERIYPPEVLARLRELKQTRDPAGTIRGNRPLLPPASRSLTTLPPAAQGS